MPISAPVAMAAGVFLLALAQGFVTVRAPDDGLEACYHSPTRKESGFSETPTESIACSKVSSDSP